VAAPGDVADLFEQAQREMGPLVAPVNNAGTTGKDARIDEQDADELARLMQVNIVGPMVDPAGHYRWSGGSWRQGKFEAGEVAGSSSVQG
jgi:NAD(P)-dependent dehydrogenase (short-subunit alcohol dehydrogenase family)